MAKTKPYRKKEVKYNPEQFSFICPTCKKRCDTPEDEEKKFCNTCLMTTGSLSETLPYKTYLKKVKKQKKEMKADKTW